jgi:hypothetical protein
MHDSLAYLAGAHGFVYVLDPFSIGAVRDRVISGRSAVLSLAHPALGNPETAYGEVINRVRDGGVKPEDQHLAVVMSKIDLLTAGGLDVPTESDAIEQWLKEVGLHQMVISARREFRQVRFFAVASVAFGENPNHDAGAPMAWLLGRVGVHMPHLSLSVTQP